MKVAVAAIHFGKTSDIDVNEDNLINLNIRAATDHHAKLIVNPEQSILPLAPESPIKVSGNADDVANSRAYAKTFALERGPRSVDRFVNEVADVFKCYVVISSITADAEYHMLFNSALLLGPRTNEFPTGVYHTYYKSVLYGDVYAVKGASPLQPANLGIGKVGVMICADYSVPLITRSFVINGSELIVIPAALTSSTLETLKVRAIENCVPLVLANCFQRDTVYDATYCPESAIVNGNEVHSTNTCEDQILTCEIDCRDSEVRSRRDKILRRRHPKLYEGALIDLTSWFLRTEVPESKSEVSVITISGKATFEDAEFARAIKRIEAITKESASVIVVLPEFPLERSAIQNYLDGLKKHHVYTVCGFVENSSLVLCLFNQNGEELLRYRKVHLSDADVNNRMRAGDRIEFYLDLPMGRVALLSGEDLLYPEAIEALRNCGVDLIVAPANLNDDYDLVFKDIARARHLSVAVADYKSTGAIYQRVSRHYPEQKIARGGIINFLRIDTRIGEIEPAKGLPSIPLFGGETIVRR
jgi:predicted amidohydrolase